MLAFNSIMNANNADARTIISKIGITEDEAYFLCTLVKVTAVLRISLLP